jgi:hypothetical protein
MFWILAPACGSSVPHPSSSRFTATAAPVCPPATSQAPSTTPSSSPAAPSEARVSLPLRDQGAILLAADATADPAVTFVSSGGYWESGSAHGRYRVVVKTHCGEHCAEEVILEQIDESAPALGIRQAVPVPETAPMRVDSVNFWPSGKWTGEIEFRLIDDDSKHSSRLCLNVTHQRNTARSGSCAH